MITYRATLDVPVHTAVQVSRWLRALRRRVDARLAITALRAPAERANALLKSTWKALRRVTLCPWRIGHIVAAALVLLLLQRGR